MGNNIFCLVQLLYINAVYNGAAAIKVTDDIIYIIIDNLCGLSVFFSPYFTEVLCILMDKAPRRAPV